MLDKYGKSLSTQQKKQFICGNLEEWILILSFKVSKSG